MFFWRRTLVGGRGAAAPRAWQRAAFCGLFLAGAGLAWGQDYDLSWFTIDGGGGASSGGDYELVGTIGQPDAGVMQGGPYLLQGGFWSGALPLLPQIVIAGREGTAGHQAYIMFDAAPPSPSTSFELEGASSPSGPWTKRTDAVLTSEGGHYLFTLDLDPGARLIFFRVKQIP